MMARGAAPAGLDASVDGILTDATTAAELFAVVDLIDGQPMLRRSLSDPSATFEDRAGLAKRLFDGRVSASTLRRDLGGAPGRLGQRRRLVAGLERQGIRLALQSAHRSGGIDEVADQLHTLAATIDGQPRAGGDPAQPDLPRRGQAWPRRRPDRGQGAPVTRTLWQPGPSRARRRNIAQTGRRHPGDGGRTWRARRSPASPWRGPLDEARIARLKAALEAQIGRTVSLQIDVDPAVLGGMNVAIDDDVIESTVAARLDQARRQLNSR